MKYYKLVLIMIVFLLVSSCVQGENTVDGESTVDGVESATYTSTVKQSNGEEFENDISSTANSSFHEESDSRQLYVDPLLSGANNDMSADQLISREYSIADISFSAYFDRSQFSGNIMPIAMINEQMKIECLRKQGAERYYAVWKIEEGGRFYGFFDGNGYYDFGYYYNSALSKKAFNRLRLGDSFLQVVQIDPVLKIVSESLDQFINNANVYYDQLNYKYLLSTVHMLPDELWLITYDDSEVVTTDSFDKQMKQIKISKIEKFKNGVLTPSDYHRQFDYNILSKDYP